VKTKRMLAAVKPHPLNPAGRVPSLSQGRAVRGRAPNGPGRGPAPELPHRREGGRDQQLVFLADWTDAGLWRPGTAGTAGFLTDARALVSILLHPGWGEFVEPA